MHDSRIGAPVNEIDSSALRYALGKACPSRDRLSRAVTKADIARAICARTPSLSLRSATSILAFERGHPIVHDLAVYRKAREKRGLAFLSQDNDQRS
jgi:hypothetical protein